MQQTYVHIERSYVVSVGAAEVLSTGRLVQHQADRTARIDNAAVLCVLNRVAGAARAASYYDNSCMSVGEVRLVSLDLDLTHHIRSPSPTLLMEEQDWDWE